MAKKKEITVKVLNLKGEEVSEISLDASVFGVEVNNQAMFDAVQVYLSNRRQGTAKTKVRHEVSGGGKKPWRQKGTGRARAGSSRSPIWVGGGTVFGPDGKQNHKLSQNKSEHALALRSALTLKAKEGLVVCENFDVEPKTKAGVEALKALKAGKKVLLVVNEINEKVSFATRNIQGLKVVEPSNVSVYDLLDVNTLIATADSIKAVEEELK